MVQNPVKKYEIIVTPKELTMWEIIIYAMLGIGALIGIGYVIHGIAAVKD